jgi:hypothetical protein
MAMPGGTSDCSELLTIANDNDYHDGFNPAYLDKGTDGSSLTYTLKYSLTCISTDGSWTVTSNEWIFYHSECFTASNIAANSYRTLVSTYIGADIEIRRDTTSTTPVPLGDPTTPSVRDFITEKTGAANCPQITNNC